jgi:arabinogalactan oligomer/maltooligosaccharide transport system permease protein
MSATSSAPKKNLLVRFLTMNTSGQTSGRDLPLWRQLLIQVLCLFILFSVMFPIMYIVTLSLSSKTTRPSSLQLIPTEISFTAYKQVLDHPTGNPVTFTELLRNSVALSVGVGLVALLVAVTAAYSFSRFNFKMREVLMVLVFIPLLMPAVGLSTPLYLLLNNIRIVDCGEGVKALIPLMTCDAGIKGKLLFNLRDSLLGVGIAITAGALPFAIWNLKGYLDTIPKELEEAAAIDGADTNQTFWKIILPLAAPQLAGICHLMAVPLPAQRLHPRHDSLQHDRSIRQQHPMEPLRRNGSHCRLARRSSLCSPPKTNRRRTHHRRRQRLICFLHPINFLSLVSWGGEIFSPGQFHAKTDSLHAFAFIVSIVMRSFYADSCSCSPYSNGHPCPRNTRSVSQLVE